MANGHGGAREGAGRKPGTHSMAPIYRAYAEELGVDPVKYMLEVIADEKQDTRMRLDAAKACAPFLAPKLKCAEVDLRNSWDGNPASISNEQLEAIIAAGQDGT